MDFSTPAAKKIFSEMGKRGGPARAAKLTPKRRSEIASLGGKELAKKRAAERNEKRKL
jgi:hypothetical protein